MPEISFLEQIAKVEKDNFKSSQLVLTMQQYLEKVRTLPQIHLRNSAQYFHDMIASLGEYKIDTPLGQKRRFSLFDADFNLGNGKICGQEHVQQSIFSHLKNYARSGRIDKLLLLHGPNGSSKTSLVQALIQAAEYYSQTKEGAIYQFSWVFPKKEAKSGSLGFNATQFDESSSYALLQDYDIEARLPSDLRDHPLLLLNQKQRQEFFGSLTAGELAIPQILQHGDLSHRNRQIFDTLLSFYHGDLFQVFKHVRVERFYFSKRYRSGISVVEPQLSIDAYVRQLTNDQSVHSLPNFLRHLSLVEVSGPLAEGNRGLIEYSDLLKRPIDAWKYLLVACEQAQVGALGLSLVLDSFLLATSNEMHLVSFKEYPDWPSFKARIELIRVPYLLNSSEEALIYKNYLQKACSNNHIAPHAIELAARWAVLTRIEPPKEENYPNSIKELVLSLTPQEKLNLYELGQPPSYLSQKQALELKSFLTNIVDEYQHDANYEGRYGASPREIQMILLNAAQDNRFDHLAVKAVFSQIESLILQKSSYEFLRREIVRGYRDSLYLLVEVKKYYQSLLEEEIRSCIKLYDENAYLDLFKKYIFNVSCWSKKEQVVNASIVNNLDIDEQFMNKIERQILASNEIFTDFRFQLMSSIAAYKLENPHKELDYLSIFSVYIKRLKEFLYSEQKINILKIVKCFLDLKFNNTKNCDEKYIKLAQILEEGLLAKGYTTSSAKCAMAFFYKFSQQSGEIGPVQLTM